MDRISLDRLALLHPAVRQEAISLYLKCNNAMRPHGEIRITQGLRMFAEQDALYAQGRTTPGAIVTRARGGYSYHNYGLALDFCLLKPDGAVSWNKREDSDQDGVADWDEVVAIFTQAGWYWGGNFGDSPHFEKSLGLSVQQLRSLHDADQLFYDKAANKRYVIV
jgi:peptidoglycan L-alanyl-D-glutamate endopeptidase CwlK